MMGASLKRVRIGNMQSMCTLYKDNNGWDLAHVLYSVLRLHTWLDRYEISELQSGVVWWC